MPIITFIHTALSLAALAVGLGLVPPSAAAQGVVLPLFIAATALAVRASPRAPAA